jgi:hypothetical protein
MASPEPENTGAMRADYATRFKPGNPGKPKGVKHKLQEDFLKDVLAAWEAKGAAAIDDMIADKPGDFVKMVAGLMPKEATLNVNTADDLTDAELIERIRHLGSAIAPFLAGGTGNANEGVEGEESPQQPVGLH